MLSAVTVAMEVLRYGAIGVLTGVLSTRSLLSGESSVLLNYLAAAVYLVLAGVAVADVLGGVMSR